MTLILGEWGRREGGGGEGGGREEGGRREGGGREEGRRREGGGRDRLTMLLFLACIFRVRETDTL